MERFKRNEQVYNFEPMIHSVMVSFQVKYRQVLKIMKYLYRELKML